MTQQFHDTLLSQDALAQRFNEARSYNDWLDKPVSDEQLHAIWDLVKMAPTSANMQPARIVWVKSAEQKAKLAECAMDANKEKIQAAPVTAIIGFDIDYHEELPWLFPHTDAKSWFDGNEPLREESALRNSSLQGAYLMLGARAVGLDCGPMSGFDTDAGNAAFLPMNRATGPIFYAPLVTAIPKAFLSAPRAPILRPLTLSFEGTRPLTSKGLAQPAQLRQGTWHACPRHRNGQRSLFGRSVREPDQRRHRRWFEQRATCA